MDNEDFLDFFTKNFTWAVFENELKWKSMEPEQGKFRYDDADKMLDMLLKQTTQVRGHCIFWEDKSEIQRWIKGLSQSDMKSVINKRLKDLLTRYKGKFKHYNVNNEMLHCSFYQDRLGKDIRATMFKRANEIDPTAILFVNDYHIEDGHDGRSSPEKYLNHIVYLQNQGAPVGGIGIQGHLDFPIGPIVCSAVDKLAKTGLPIWFSEIDVSSINEFVRADDLEVMLREAFAHSAVNGIMLWGFWELLMFRKDAHLVNAEGEVNEAGKRYLALKEEWLSHANGKIDDQGQFKFRGFHGTYEVELVTRAKKKEVKTYVVEPKSSPKTLDPVVISFNL